MIEYIYFDVSGTLLWKPHLFIRIKEVLNNSGFKRNLNEIKSKHKLLSEVIRFPDYTDVGFYNTFNSELLYLLGILPTDKLLEEIFKNCTYLRWEKYEDTNVLESLNIPIGIISNFNSTLKDKLSSFFVPRFQHILVSEEEGIAKPDVGLYELAAERCGVRPENILYIGDSFKLDLEPAVKAGMKSLVIDRDNFYNQSDRCITRLHSIKKYLV